MGTPTGRVMLFGTIPTVIPDTTPVITLPATQTDTPVIPTKTPIIAPTIPPSLDYTPASPDYSPASDSESDPSEDPLSDHIPPLPAISPFLSSDDDPTDSDTPSSPTQDTPFTEITASTQRSPIIPCRRVMLLAPGQPIPHGRPYRYHLNGPVHMMTARKRVGPLPTHHLAERHSADHSSSDSSSKASSDFHSDASSDPSSRHSLSDHSSPDLPKLVARRVAEELEAREAARTLEPLNEDGDELEGENRGNGNGGNGNGNGGNGNGNGGNGNGNGGNGNGGNGNRNGNHGMNYGGFMPVARECTFQDFLKCK
ncbi:hypothetical protein Tco_0062739, partial [Tanacetum coccineum]